MSENIEQLITEPRHELEYRVIGLMRGVFQSEADNRGYLLTPDQQKINAFVINRCLWSSMQKKPELFEQEQVWTVYARTESEYGPFRVQVKHYKPDLELQTDIFSVRGVITWINEERNIILVKIRRNVEIPKGQEKEKRYKPFVVELQGNLEGVENAENALGNFWEIEAERQGTKLHLRSAKFVKEMPKRKKNFRKKGPGGKKTPYNKEKKQRFAPIANKPKVLDLRTQKIPPRPIKPLMQRPTIPAPSKDE